MNILKLCKENCELKNKKLDFGVLCSIYLSEPFLSGFLWPNARERLTPTQTSCRPLDLPHHLTLTVVYPIISLGCNITLIRGIKLFKFCDPAPVKVLITLIGTY